MKKIKLVTVVGTRPELIRLSLLISKCDQVFNHILVHSGQNYDYELNQIFFDDLNIRKPDYFLKVSSNNLGKTLGNILTNSYELFQKITPDALLVLGDTNSSLCILSAKRLKIPIFHMEAGNRCFDMNVPEEINRKVADHLADINLTYTENSRRYLLSEGFRKDHIFCTGSPMREVLENNIFEINKSQVLKTLNLLKGNYIVASIHREENVDINNNLVNIIEGLEEVANHYEKSIIFSCHPRTQKKVKQSKIKANNLINFIKPLGFFDYVKLQSEAFITLSDSGTISEESAIMKFPAVSIRTSTERPEAIDFGSIVLGNIDKESILQSTEIALKTFKREDYEIPFEYKSKSVSNRVIRIIQGFIRVVNTETWRK